MSPIANTRMVAAALERARKAGGAGGGGGLSLGSIPGPENLGPLGAHLVSGDFGWCSGQVLFAGGSEVAVVDRPRLLEVVRTDEVASLEGVLQSVIPRAFVKAETAQATDGGANPRFGPIFDEPAPVEPSRGPVTSCAIVSDRPDMAAAIVAALEARSIICHRVEVAPTSPPPPACAQRVVDHAGPIDALVVASRRSSTHRVAERGVGGVGREPPRDRPPPAHRCRMVPVSWRTTPPARAGPSGC